MLVTKLYAYAFLGEFILLYPVYTLLFADAGLSVAESSVLFVIWSVTGMVLEVPSGAWADAVSRRLLLFLGPLLAGAGYALWVSVPSFWAFAAGFVLWGAQGALVSGSFEALAYEELERRGQEGRYAAVMGRAEAAGLVANALAIGLAVPAFAAGGYAVVGVASVAACVLCAVTALTLPEHRAPRAAGDGGYVAVLRSGLAVARADRAVFRALLLVAVVTAIWGALEEYVPFLGVETGVAESAVPLLVLVVWIGATAGGLLAGAAARLPDRAYGLTVAAAAVALAAGALSGHPAGFVLIAGAFGAFQLAGIVADARLQERIGGAARATVTSVAGLGVNVITLAVYAGYGAVSGRLSNGAAFALFALPYLVVAVLSGRRARAVPQ